MSLDLEKPNKSLNKDFYVLSLVISIYLFFTVISFRNYFFFIPNFDRQEKLIAFMQVMTTIGWISLILLPPILLRRRQQWSKFSSLAFLLSSLIWPASTMSIKILNFIHFGSPYVGYLNAHPLFLLMEFAVPAFYIYLWVRIRRQKLGK
jgi:hypothetical protein